MNEYLVERREYGDKTVETDYYNFEDLFVVFRTQGEGIVFSVAKSEVLSIVTKRKNK